MIEVKDLTEQEIDEVLTASHYGHLGCCRGGVPYVLPVNYAYLPGEIFIYTTEGKKTDFIDENPNVCLQVEDVKSDSGWRSVVLTGTASRITDLDERERVVQLLANKNPTFTPAVSIHWIDDWVRENHEVVYRVNVVSATGRRSAGASPVLARRSTI